MKEIVVDFKELYKDDKGINYKVCAGFPLEYGYITDTRINMHKNNYSTSLSLKHSYNDKDYCYFENTIYLNKSNIYRYDISYKANNVLYNSNKDDYKLSVLYDTPSWTKGGVIYHIFVDRFNKGRSEELKSIDNRIVHKSVHEKMIIGPDKNGVWNNDYYGGDLRGIINKLDYIKSLGTTIIYLSPIVKSQSNHRYDTADYESIDPYIGNFDDLKELCDKCHKMNIHVILDAVFNHTGNDSKYFNEYNHYDTLGAYQSDKSEYYPFYRKFYHDGKVMFDYWWGMKNLPVCDSNSYEWRHYVYSVIDKWMNAGVDGLRLDVADELSDGFIRGISREVIKNKNDGFVLGEVWKNPMRMNRDYMEYMHSVMNYPLIDALIRYYKYNDKEKLGRIINEIQREYPDSTINSLMNFTSTHDISRIINILSTNEFSPYNEWAWDPVNKDLNYQSNYKISKDDYIKGMKVYKSYLLSLAYMRGNLSIFYGDELGVSGLGNLENRAAIDWNNINNDILSYYKELLNTRNKEEYLKEAGFNIVDINDKYLMYERLSKKYNYLISVNKSEDRTVLKLPSEYSDSKEIFTLNDSNKEVLDSFGGLVLKKENTSK